MCSKDIQYADYKNVNLLDTFNVFFLQLKHSNFLFSNWYSNISNKLLQANAPTYRVQTFLIKCTLNGYVKFNMSAEFQKGLGWSRPLLSLMSKYCLMI